MSRSLGIAFNAVAEITQQDITDQKRVERAKRLMESESWAKDFFPILTELYDKYLSSVKDKSMDPDTLKVFDDIMSAIDGSIQMGVNALKRMAERRLKAAESLEKTKAG